ncbi:MAG: DUF4248 domain-containing protein [Bacteroidetes bacterium]|nr:MAG: DUF4248 domain-containing protein [Bacteroidota bacterium]
MENKVKLVSKNLSTLAAEYGVSLHTMRKWLLLINGLKVEGRTTRDYTPKEVEIIYNHLGVPNCDYDQQ